MVPSSRRSCPFSPSFDCVQSSRIRGSSVDPGKSHQQVLVVSERTTYQVGTALHRSARCDSTAQPTLTVAASCIYHTARTFLAQIGRTEAYRQTMHFLTGCHTYSKLLLPTRWASAHLAGKSSLDSRFLFESCSLRAVHSEYHESISLGVLLRRDLSNLALVSVQPGDLNVTSSKTYSGGHGLATLGRCSGLRQGGGQTQF